MISIIASINPRHCVPIADGDKSLEMRKSKPKEVPFKVYIYCTGVKSLNLATYCDLHRRSGGRIDEWAGKIIGEFVCDRVYQYTTGNLTEGMDISTEEVTRMACLSYEELMAYENSAEPKENCLYMVGLYAWHITDLQIYRKPKGLGDFIRPGTDAKGFSRPPQSWYYAAPYVPRQEVNTYG